MSEVKGIVERCQKEHVASINKDKWIVLVGGKTYDVWSPRIESFLLKELPAGTTMTPAKDDKYNPKLNLPQEQGAGGGFSKRPFQTRDDSTTAWDTILMQGIEMLKLYSCSSRDEAARKLVDFHAFWWKQYKQDVKKEG